MWRLVQRNRVKRLGGQPQGVDLKTNVSGRTIMATIVIHRQKTYFKKILSFKY